MASEQERADLDSRIRMLENALRKLERGQIAHPPAMREDLGRRLEVLRAQRRALTDRRTGLS